MSSKKKHLEPVSLEKLSILTERQRVAYLLRTNGMTYARIGKELSISSSAAGQLIHHAERRFREYDRYMDARERNTTPVDFPITRGELLLALAGLELLQKEVEKGHYYTTNPDWSTRLPYKYQRIRNLYKRIQRAVYDDIVPEHEKGYEDERAGAAKEESNNNEAKEGRTE